jgi:uncharacterized protein YbjT (DUF2867 family)
MTTLVIGATGNVGSRVVRELRDRGVVVRAFVRDRERAAKVLGGDVELAAGDLADSDAVKRALQGAERVFLACANVPGQVEYECGAIDAAKAASVERVVKLSTNVAAVDSPLLFPRRHGHIERHLRRSGVPSVLICPGFFMTNLLASAHVVRQTGTLAVPAGRARIAMIHPADVAAAAAVALAEDGHEGSRYELTGPRAITYAEIARDLTEASGRTVEYVNIPDEVARQGMLDAGFPPVLAEFLITLYSALRGGLGEAVNDTVEQLIGRPPRSFAGFAREHAALFGAVTAGMSM